MVVTIHQVGINKVNKFNVPNWNIFSRQEFLAIPHSERVEIIMNGNVKFYDSEGNVISVKEAIKSINLK